MQDFFWKTPDGLQCHGLAFRHEEAGEDSPALVCLHGLTRNALDFAEFAEWVTGPDGGLPPVRVYCPSLRGRGRSARDTDFLNYQPRIYREDILSLLGQLKLEQAVFVGTSLGGIVTMLIGESAPDHIRAAILNDIAPELRAEGLERITDYVGADNVFDDWAAAAAWCRDINGNAFPDEGPEFWDRFARNTCEETARGIETAYDKSIAMAFGEVGPAPDLWPGFLSLTMPVLSVRGAISDLFTAETQSLMKDRLPHLQMAQVPRIGHAPMLSEPVAKDAIAAFLKPVLT